MAGIHSKNKGKGYEREVAAFLIKTYNEPFLRTPSSGAFVGGKNAYRKDSMSAGQIRGSKGDIIPPDDWDYLSTECKFYKEFPFHLLFTGDVGLLDNWIEQQNVASGPNDVKIIFMKFNRKGQWVAYPAGLAFETERAILYKDWYFCAAEQFWTESNAALLRTLAISGIS